MTDEKIDAALRDHAARVVEEWKAAHGKPMLSPAQAKDLTNRILDAMLWAREQRALMPIYGSRPDDE